MSVPIPARDPLGDAAASLLLPGLGQWLQGRRVAAMYYGGDVTAAAVLGALVPELRAVAWTVALAVTIWSILDAAVAARRLPSSAV
jgi:hypothetical protein